MKRYIKKELYTVQWVMGRGGGRGKMLKSGNKIGWKREERGKEGRRRGRGRERGEWNLTGELERARE
jgi:hypothetical protein